MYPNYNRKDGGLMPKKDSSPIKTAKKRHSVWIKWLIFVFAILLTVFLAWYLYMKEQTKASRLAEDYVSVFMSKDSGALFDFIGFQPDTFITKDSFQKSMEECHKYSSLTSYSLIQYNSGRENQMQYNLKFWDNNHNNPYSQTLLLNLSSSRLYFLFEQWEIDTTEYLAKNCTLDVPAGASVTVDGIELPDKINPVSNGELDTYSLGNLFIGTHTITVSMDGFEDYTATASLPAGDYSGKKIYTITNSLMKITADTEKTLAQLAKDFIKAMYKSALAGQDFESAANSFSIEESQKAALAQSYDTLISNHIRPATHLTQVDFINFESTASSSYAEDGCYAIQITSDTDYTADSVIVSSSANHSATQNRRTSGSSLFTTTLHYKGGVWSIYDSTALETCVYYLRA